jgi:hypothetical protein
MIKVEWLNDPPRADESVSGPAGAAAAVEAGA